MKSPNLFPRLQPPYRDIAIATTWLVPVLLGAVAAYLGLWTITNVCLALLAGNLLLVVNENLLAYIVLVPFSLCIAIVEMVNLYGLSGLHSPPDMLLLTIFLGIVSSLAFELGKLGQVAWRKGHISIFHVLMPAFIIGPFAFAFNILTGNESSWYAILLMTGVPYCISYWKSYNRAMNE